MAELTPGVKTTEGVTSMGAVFGLLGSGIAGVFEVLQDPTMPWYGKLVCVALLLLAGSAQGLGYLNARTNLKGQLQKILATQPATTEAAPANPPSPPPAQ